MPAPFNTQVTLNVVYDGPSLADGSMNVRDLAPVLMAIGGLFDDANRIANGPQASIGVNVRATAAGSFEIFLEVAQKVGESGILQGGIGDFISTAADLKELLIGGGGAVAGGVIWLTKRLRGRIPRIEKINDEIYRIVVSDDESYEVPLRLLRMYQDIDINQNINEIVRPLNRPGIDSIKFRGHDVTIQEITKEDVPSFTLSDYKEKLVDETTRRVLSIVRLVFKENNKWRLSDGDTEMSVTITDKNYLKNIDDGVVTFSKLDVLVCELRTVQWMTRDGLVTEHEVVKIIQHRTTRQLSIFGDSPKEDIGER